MASEDWLHRWLQRLPGVSDHSYRDPLHLQVRTVTHALQQGRRQTFPDSRSWRKPGRCRFLVIYDKIPNVWILARMFGLKDESRAHRTEQFANLTFFTLVRD